MQRKYSGCLNLKEVSSNTDVPLKVISLKVFVNVAKS